MARTLLSMAAPVTAEGCDAPHKHVKGLSALHTFQTLQHCLDILSHVQHQQPVWILFEVHMVSCKCTRYTCTRVFHDECSATLLNLEVQATGHNLKWMNLLVLQQHA